METAILQLKNITKSFFGNKALSNVDFDLRESEIHCICGENGAGKSTLIKILSGALTPDEGKIEIEDKKYTSLIPKISHDLGIHVIYQENLLLNDMNVAENIFVGQEKTSKFGIINYKELYKETKCLIEMMGVDIDVHEIVGNLSVANQQYVKIAKSLAYDPKILIMDEPTAMFNIMDAAKLMEIVKNLKRRGISIIYISHKLSEVLEIADRVTVLRDGHKICCREREGGTFSVDQITSDMIGRPVDLFYKREWCPIGDEIFTVKDLLVQPESPPVSFNLRKGEILGIAGMVGSGRTEIVQRIFGVRKKYGGNIFLHGNEVIINEPKEAIKNGICLITEDRQKTGLLLDMTIASNITITALEKIKGLFLRLKEEESEAKKITNRVNLKTLKYNTDARFLSGGNQQKVVVGKWIFRDAEIIIFDEPTRGIDVNSKAEIYTLMIDLLKEGKSIIMISSDMPELISVSDRVLVVKKGKIVAQLTGKEISEKNIISNTI
jgi:ABC-type sugar transport system ATPase subunit